ncbi:MAG: hypothetical protein Kow0062_21440 [Acidobacteriota bacterium]
MSLSGTLSTMALADLLQWAASAQKTGRFDFRRNEIVKEVYLRDGVVVGAASNQHTEMLGHVLVARGMLNEEQLRASLLARREQDEFLGNVVVRLGFVTQDALVRALAERTEEIIYSLFEWEDAEFKFHPGAKPGANVVLIALPVDHVLLRGVHRHDEMMRIREEFPNGRVVLGRTEREVPQEVLAHPLARRILDAIDERRTIDELALLVHASPFPVQKFLFEALKLGLVRIVSLEGPALPRITTESPDEELSEMSVPARLRTARQKLEAGDAESALELLTGDEVLAEPEAKELLARAEPAFLDKFYRDEFPEDAIPELTRPIEDLTSETLRPEEFFLLSRLDGAWSVRDIVEVAPLREVETVRVLRRLVRRGLVRIPRAGDAPAPAEASRNSPVGVG